MLFSLFLSLSFVEKIPFFRFDATGKNSCRFPNQGQNVVNLIKPFWLSRLCCPSNGIRTPISQQLFFLFITHDRTFPFHCVFPNSVNVKRFPPKEEQFWQRSVLKRKKKKNLFFLSSRCLFRLLIWYTNRNETIGLRTDVSGFRK